MKVFMLWHGGSSYSPPTCEDTEEFDTIAELKRSFGSRSDDRYYPCVYDDVPEEGGPEGWVFFHDPRTGPDDYPDRLIHFGPRGGVRLEYA
jgi:hypothetical protein